MKKERKIQYFNPKSILFFLNGWTRKIYCFFLFMLLSVSFSSHAQTHKKELARFKKINLEMLKDAYDGFNTDSTKCMELIAIAQDLNNDSLLAIGYNYLAFYFDAVKGDNTSSFEYYYKALPLALAVNDKRRISSIYFDISTGLIDLKNYEEALRNIWLGYQNLPNKDHPRYNWMLLQFYNNMGSLHALKNNSDSAYHYAQKTLALNKETKSLNMEYNALSVLAHHYSLEGDFDNGDLYFEKARILSESIDMNQAVLGFNLLYIPHLLKQEKLEEVKAEARNLMLEGRQYNHNHLILSGAQYLKIVFEKEGQIDSAFHYSKIESETNSLIYNQGNINKVQGIRLDETLRKIESENQKRQYENQLQLNVLLGSSFTLFIVAALLFRSRRAKQKSKDQIEQAYHYLQNTQSQLIHSEKMASLGELTAGIAHEIQNPLNFVNNFSEVNKELIEDLKDAISKNDQEEVNTLLSDLLENEDKVVHHGKRAEEIVRSMLLHSRGSDGKKELTDINALCDEYLRLAYHGFRAKDKSFNADFELDLDESLPKVEVVPQDIGRVLLNLINNAFQACAEQSKLVSADSSVSTYQPKVTLITQFLNNSITIRVADNGPGIPEDIKDKIFQPFFTTKPTGQGTGLGLSMSYDIVTKGHGGKLEVESGSGKGTEFIVKLPIA